MATGVWDASAPIARPSGGSSFTSIAVSETTIATGGSIRGAPGHGTVWVFELIPATGVWTLSQEVLPATCCSPTTTSPSYGGALALDGGRLAVGDPADSTTSSTRAVTSARAAYRTSGAMPVATLAFLHRRVFDDEVAVAEAT